jgi:hypothetical protein
MTVAVLLSLAAVGELRYREWTSHTLAADVVVEVRKQFAERRSSSATLEDLVAKLEADPDFVATRPPTRNVGGGSTASAYIESLQITIAGLRSGDSIYCDVLTRWPELSERQRFEVASLIGNATGVNAEFYRFRTGWRRALLDGRGLFGAARAEFAERRQRRVVEGHWFNAFHRLRTNREAAYAASSASVSLIGTSTPSSNRAARTSSPFIASMNFLNVPM